MVRVDLSHCISWPVSNIISNVNSSERILKIRTIQVHVQFSSLNMCKAHQDVTVFPVLTVRLCARDNTCCDTPMNIIHVQSILFSLEDNNSIVIDSCH